MNRPAGNITGVVNLSNILVTKRIELMRQVVPSAKSIALLVDPGVATSEAFVGDAKKVEALLAIRIEVLLASTLSEIEAAFSRIAELQAGALIVGVGPVFTSYAQQIAELASRYAVPASHEARDFARAGGLLSYGADLPDAYRLTGAYAARVLNGEKPANLPVQQAAKNRDGYQSQDRESTRNHVPTAAFGPRRRGDRITTTFFTAVQNVCFWH
jgi:ABC-type uncharacterized transport system substrate-binding protein